MPVIEGTAVVPDSPEDLTHSWICSRADDEPAIYRCKRCGLETSGNPTNNEALCFGVHKPDEALQKAWALGQLSPIAGYSPYRETWQELLGGSAESALEEEDDHLTLLKLLSGESVEFVEDGVRIWRLDNTILSLTYPGAEDWNPISLPTKTGMGAIYLP